MKNTKADAAPSLRGEILKYAAERYNTRAEYLWLSLPNYAVLRHADNKKWYGLIMDVPRERLGLSGKGVVDILDIKCDPILIGSLRLEKGFLPAYHMHHGNWVTALLDGTVETEKILALLDLSFEITADKPKVKRTAKKSD